jgi:hypothetical protein
MGIAPTGTEELCVTAAQQSCTAATAHLQRPLHVAAGSDEVLLGNQAVDAIDVAGTPAGALPLLGWVLPKEHASSGDVVVHNLQQANMKSSCHECWDQTV